MSSLPQLTDEEKQQWLKDKYQVATKFLAEKGLVTVSVSDADSRYIIPLFSVWKLNLIDYINNRNNDEQSHLFHLFYLLF
mgnify:CR=1 FL=1